MVAAITDNKAITEFTAQYPMLCIPLWYSKKRPGNNINKIIQQIDNTVKFTFFKNDSSKFNTTTSI